MGALVYASTLATVYTTSSAGDWSTCTNWIGGTCPPDPLAATDTIIVAHAMVYDVEQDVAGYMLVQASGSITGDENLKIDGGTLDNYGSIDLDTKKLDIKAGGVVSNYATIVTDKVDVDVGALLVNRGSLTIEDDLHIDGVFANYDYTYAFDVHCDGDFCNNDTLEIDPGEKFDAHGCDINWNDTDTCGDGWILTCEIKMHDNVGTEPYMSRTDFCCPNGDPASITTGDGYVDEALVSMCGVVLPVELLYMNAELQYNGRGIRNTVILRWETASELNNWGFYVERSHDGRRWEKLDFVPGLGTTSQGGEYEFEDLDPLEGISYYRLRQMDLDGVFEFLEPVALRNTKYGEANLHLYPNPVEYGQYAILSASGLDPVDRARLRVVDGLGRILLDHQVFPDAAGRVELPIAPEQLGAGVYSVSLVTPVDKVTQKLVIRYRR